MNTTHELSEAAIETLRGFWLADQERRSRSALDTRPQPQASHFARVTRGAVEELRAAGLINNYNYLSFEGEREARARFSR